MKKQLFVLPATLTVSAIVLTLGVTVNHQLDRTPRVHSYRMADGVPLPPPTQPPPKVEVSDGVPLPPPTQPPPKFAQV